MSPQLSRRSFIGCACCATVGGLASLGALPGHRAFAADQKTSMTPDQALAALKEGNEKFVTDVPDRSVTDRNRRWEIARGQTPFAVLVSCSDSRVPPELLFGRGLGDLFMSGTQATQWTPPPLAQSSMRWRNWASRWWSCWGTRGAGLLMLP